MSEEIEIEVEVIEANEPKFKKRAKKVEVEEVIEVTAEPVVEEVQEVITEPIEVVTPKADRCTCGGRAVRIINRFGRHQVCTVCNLKK